MRYEGLEADSLEMDVGQEVFSIEQLRRVCVYSELCRLHVTSRPARYKPGTILTKEYYHILR